MNWIRKIDGHTDCSRWWQFKRKFFLFYPFHVANSSSSSTDSSFGFLSPNSNVIFRDSRFKSVSSQIRGDEPDIFNYPSPFTDLRNSDTKTWANCVRNIICILDLEFLIQPNTCCVSTNSSWMRTSISYWEVQKPPS